MIAFLVFFAIVFAAATSGAIFKPGEWYDGLSKPPWTPPGWAFPVVWSILYVKITVAGWLVWSASGWEAWPALAVYVVSLMLNAGWSALFFGVRRMGWAMADVIVLWLSIVATMVVFVPHTPLAAALLAPYLLWVTIAATLNLRMIQLNPEEATAS